VHLTFWRRFALSECSIVIATSQTKMRERNWSVWVTWRIKKSADWVYHAHQVRSWQLVKLWVSFIDGLFTGLVLRRIYTVFEVRKHIRSVHFLSDRCVICELLHVYSLWVYCISFFLLTSPLSNLIDLIDCSLVQAVTSSRSENHTDYSVACNGNRGFRRSTYINNHENWR